MYGGLVGTALSRLRLDSATIRDEGKRQGGFRFLGQWMLGKGASKLGMVWGVKLDLHPGRVAAKVLTRREISRK